MLAWIIVAYLAGFATATCLWPVLLIWVASADDHIDRVMHREDYP